MPKQKTVAIEPLVEPIKLHIFVSWSGDRSRQVAEAIAAWIPNVLQDVRTFVSSNDIDAGSNWFGNVSSELSDTDFGVICLTTENLEKPWVLFEAGALAKKVSDRTRVVPYLHGVSPSDLAPPLSLFQGVGTDREGTYALLRSINALRAERFEEARLKAIFDKWWSELEAKLGDIASEAKTAASGRRPEREILEEIISILRGGQRTSPYSTRTVVPQNEQMQMSEKHLKQSLVVQLLLKLADLVPVAERETAYPAKTNIQEVVNDLKRELNRLRY